MSGFGLIPLGNSSLNVSIRGYFPPSPSRMGDCYGTVSAARGATGWQGVSMHFAVGVDFGSTRAKVAITKWDNDSGSAVKWSRVVATIPCVAFLGADQELTIGDHAQKLGATDPHRVIRDFKRRIGDSVPIVADGWCVSTESIMATFVRKLVDDVCDEQNVTPDLVALAHPAHWGPYKQALLADALRDAGLPEVLLVPEPAAAVRNAVVPATGAIGTVLVYDLGGGSFDAAVMTRSAAGEFHAVGIPQGLDWLGGDDFDQAIFTRVREGVRLQDRDPADPEALAQMARLREACTQAKETLSLDTEVTIPVATTRYRTRFRLVRSEFDELVRDAIEDTLDATRRAIGSAGLSVSDVDAIVLAGGSSRIPLVAQMISAEFSLPILVDSRPEDAIAQGAAQLAKECVQARLAAMLPAPAVPPDVAKAPSAEAMPTGDTAPATREPASGRAAWPESGAQAAPVAPVAREEQRSGPDDLATGPIPPVVGDETPSAANNPERGRHRHRSRRPFGLRTAGIIVAAGCLVLAGSTVAALQVGDPTVPAEPSQSGDAVGSPAGSPITTTPPAAAPDSPAPAVVAPTANSAQPRPTTSTSTSGPERIAAPTVVVDRTDRG